jgi:hypothetical protein
MRLIAIHVVALTVASTFLGGCGGSGGTSIERAEIEAAFSGINPPFDSPSAMRAILESNGVSVLEMECGFATPNIGVGGSRRLYWEATIDASLIAKALTLGPFRVVVQEFVAERAGVFPC